MLTILTTIETLQKVEDAICSVDRLDELVSVVQLKKGSNDLKTLVVEADGIIYPVDWFDLEPPYVFPIIPFSKESILALAFYKLGNHQKAFEFISETSPLYHHLLIATHLQFGYEISDEMLSFCRDNSAHNYAVVSYYGNVENRLDYPTLQSLFLQAVEVAENDELSAFSGKHFLNFLMDAGELALAKESAENYLDLAISEGARYAISSLLVNILMSQLQMPHDLGELARIRDIQLETITFYEKKELYVSAGLLLIEAAEVANFRTDFIESKTLINKAIHYFKQEDIPEFLGEAGLKKAILMYTWSKNGSPQYYKAAINAFQDALKIFKQDTHPQKFADIHHNLALIYSEIPVDPKERPIWTAFCASSFKKVMAFYTKDEYPYEYAMVSHNYATALMHFPPAKIHDNLDKAETLFGEALRLRTATHYPFERALTLLNLLELEWLTHNATPEEEQRKFEAMKTRAEEVKNLVQDNDLIARANTHLKELEKVKGLI